MTRSSFTRLLALAAFALVTALPAQAVTATPAANTASAPANKAAYEPSAKQLAALCSTCAIVTATAVEKRKGKATGVGAVGGAVAGGVVGNKVGDGAVATGVGAVAGGVLGNEIEKRMKRHKVWTTTVTARDGKSQRYEAAADPAFKVGEVVRIDNGMLAKLSAAK